MKNPVLTVLIIGCGNIAGRFDSKNPSTSTPYTHMGAYRNHTGFQVVACVEPDDFVREEFRSIWKIADAYRHLDELVEQKKTFDIISICSPTPCHQQAIEYAMALEPQLIFCEKPVTLTATETQYWVNRCAQKKIFLAVNYTRRWDPQMVSLKKDMSRHHYGYLRSISAIYNKGLLNNGSHLIDLLWFLLGDLSVHSVGRAVVDYTKTDPSVPGLLYTKGGIPISLTVGYAQDFAVFEIQFVFSKGVLSMKDGGLFWEYRPAIESQTFAGYQQLGDVQTIPGNYPQAMKRAIDNLYGVIVHGEPLQSHGNTALRVQQLCETMHSLINQ